MKIAITRLKEKAAEDPALFSRYGHECLVLSPLQAELNPSAIQRFVLEANDGGFDAIFFTSSYSADKIAPLLDRHITRRCRVVAIGPKTTRVLFSFGIAAETLPTYYSRDFARYLGDWIEGKRIGIPRADIPNPELMDTISEKGGYALEYRCYRLKPTNTPLDLEGAEALLFTSAESFKRAKIESFSGILPLAIGERTAEAMQEGGVVPAVVGNGSLEGTLEALNTFLGQY